MNGRVHHDDTPEGRLAAVARSLAIRMAKGDAQMGIEPSEADYADYRDALRPFVKREILLARIDEARRTYPGAIAERMRELTTELIDVNAQLPEEHRI